MSFAITAVVTVAAVSAYVSYENGKKQAAANEKAMKQAKASAAAQAAQAEQAANREQQKRPDTTALLAAAQQSGRAGPSGTMLTGPAGVDPSTLALGRNTLLGS